jgi:hypothetical protein
MEVTTEQIVPHFQHAVAVLNGIPAHFVFNIDEIGHEDLVDRQVKTCHVLFYDFVTRILDWTR